MLAFADRLEQLVAIRGERFAGGAMQVDIQGLKGALGGGLRELGIKEAAERSDCFRDIILSLTWYEVESLACMFIFCFFR